MPNTKTKKFDWQIFLAVFSILLVICCATICCVVSNTDRGVARAEDSTVTNLTNLTFETSDNFYIKNLTGSTTEELESYIYYFTNGIEGVLSDSVDFTHTLQVGTYALTYNTSSTLLGTLEFELNQISSYGVFYLTCYIKSGNSNHSLFNILYMYTSSPKTFEFTTSQSTSSDDSKYTYNVPTLNSLDWFVVFGISANSVNSIKFNFNYTTNLGCIISPNDTYATIPDLGGGDTDELQAEINRLTGIVQDQRNEIQYYESLNLNQSQIPIFNIARCSPSTFEYDGVTYTSDTIERTSSGWDIYHSSYLNQELPENFGVGFSLFLVETLSNTKFDMSPLIQCWYNYTGATTRLLGFSVGYRNQNGQIVKVGEFSSDLPAENEFFINAPTNEIVFFEEDCNLMEVDNDFSIVRYQYDTESIYNDGYDAGLRWGLYMGRQEGYNEGVLDANDYSFFSLFTSVFDAPITAIVGKWGDSDGDGVYQREGGMLNFYIPGLDINFAPFLLSLFTIGLIVLIIRFILARKS